MLTTFTLLLAAGVGCRLALSLALSRYSDRALEVPQSNRPVVTACSVAARWPKTRA